MTHANSRKALPADRIASSPSASTCSCGSRRQFLSGVAAFGAAAVVPFRAAEAQQPANSKPYVIDVHHHMYSPNYLKKALEAGYNAPVMQNWTPQRCTEEMDRVGIGTAVLSVSSPGVWFGHQEEDRGVAREVNEFIAKLQSDHPGRFGHFASIPLPDTDGSIKEIEYALDTLKANGIVLMTNYDGKLAGDPAFAPVFDELNRRKAVVFFHPTADNACTQQFPNQATALLDYPFDTARTIVSLLYSGTLSRNPDIRFIFPHGGGATLMLTYRIIHTSRGMKDVAARLPKGAEYELKRLHFETAQASNPVAMAAILKMVQIAQVLYGSDTPYVDGKFFLEELQGQGLSDADLATIHHGTAQRLMPGLKSVAQSGSSPAVARA